MTTLQMILLGITFIIGYTLSYLLWTRVQRKRRDYYIEILESQRSREYRELWRQWQLEVAENYNKQAIIEAKDEQLRSLWEITDPHKGMSNMEIAKYYDRLSKDNNK